MSKYLRVGSVAAGLLCAAIFATDARMSAAEHDTDIIVAGLVTIDPAVKAVQHPVSGIIAEILRRDGDQVKSGELLARLDDTVIRTNLLLSSNGLDQLLARRARLEAERDGNPELKFPSALAGRAEDGGTLAVMEVERRTFAARLAARKSESDLQQLRIVLLEEELNGLRVQEKAKADELTLISRELGGVRQLHGQNLAPLQRLTALERDAIRIDGEQRGAIPVGIAQAKSRIADTQLQIVRTERDNLRDIANELRDTDEKLRDLVQRKADFEDQLKRAQILAPQDGIILSSAIRAAGCPVEPGKDLMFIAPPNERPSVEAKVDLPSASRLRIGQAAKLVVVSSGTANGEFSGRLERISPMSPYAGEGHPYVTLRFVLAPDVQADLAQLPPGASVRVSIPATPGQDTRAFLDLGTLVKQPLQRIERALL